MMLFCFGAGAMLTLLAIGLIVGVCVVCARADRWMERNLPKVERAWSRRAIDPICPECGYEHDRWSCRAND